MYATQKIGAVNTADKKGRKPLFFQPKLSVNEPGDAYEQEADDVANRVMRMPVTVAANDHVPFFSPSPIINKIDATKETCLKKEFNEEIDETVPEIQTGLSFDGMPPNDNKEDVKASLQRTCSHCEEEQQRLQRKEITADTPVAKESTESYISSIKGIGRPLTNQERSFFEPRMGYDFSSVRIHNDNNSHQSAKDINALAYTHGSNIVFGAGQYQPNTSDGKRLMAHELTHVVQQQPGDNTIRRFEARVHEREEMSGLTGGKDPLTLEEAQSAYFGNWMRDLNQVFVPIMDRLGISQQVLFSIVSYMAAKKFGHIMTPEQFGYYIPSEHIDNPAGLVQQYDLLSNPPTGKSLNAPLVPGAQPVPSAFTTQQESADPTASILGANIFSVDQTGTMAYIRRSNLHVERRLDLAANAGRTPEGLMHFGAALHAVEDLFAHSNWIEIAVAKLLQDPSLLPSLKGTNREVFTYSPTVNAGDNTVEKPQRPVLTTGSFTGDDTIVSLSSELVGFLLTPLSPPLTDAERRVEEQMMRVLIGSFEKELANNPGLKSSLSAFLTKNIYLVIKNPLTPDGASALAAKSMAKTALDMPLVFLYDISTWFKIITGFIVPESIRLAWSKWWRDTISTEVLQPLGKKMQRSAQQAMIADTSLIKNLEVNTKNANSKGPIPLSPVMEAQQAKGIPMAQIQKEAKQEAALRVKGLQATPEHVVAGPSHSQINKDHTNAPFYGIAFTIANLAVSRMRDKMVAVWTAKQGGLSIPFDFSKPNFPSIPASPPAEHDAATNASDLYHQTRSRRAGEAGTAQSKGLTTISKGGEGQPYDLAAMRKDSADRLRAVAAVFNGLAQAPTTVDMELGKIEILLGKVLPEQLSSIKAELQSARMAAQKASRSTSAKELADFAVNLAKTAATVEIARSFAERATIHNSLIMQRIYAIQLLSGSVVNLFKGALLIVIFDDQIANTQSAYLAEQKDVLNSGQHIAGLTQQGPPARSVINLPPAHTDFAGNPRSVQQVALIEEARLLMNHPYESNWWVQPVTAYIKANEKQILNDIEARNEGVPLFRRPGERTGN